MKVARLYAPGDLRIEDAPEPTAGPGEIVIRVRSCSTCGTDAKVFHHGHHHISLPRVLGHEIAGEVSEVGPEVEHWSPGDRVQVIAAIPDGVCYYCRRRQQTVCENLESIGYQYDGAFAEYMRVPSKVLDVEGVNRIPEGVPFEAASLTEPLACVLNGQEIAEVGEGDTVTILGAGPIGCLHTRLARARGAAMVILADVNQNRLDMAARAQPDVLLNGANEDPVDAVRKLTDGRGADVVITATGAGQAQEQALEMAAPRGRISLFGGLPRDNSIIRFDSNLVHYRELFVLGAYGSAPRHNRDALGLISSGAVPVEDLITHRLPLDQVHRAIETVTKGEGLKVVIEPAAGDRRVPVTG
ncbi:MAG: zinc-dependent dehydrogenase [Actinomycetota bacterium]